MYFKMSVIFFFLIHRATTYVWKTKQNNIVLFRCLFPYFFWSDTWHWSSVYIDFMLPSVRADFAWNILQCFWQAEAVATRCGMDGAVCWSSDVPHCCEWEVEPTPVEWYGSCIHNTKTIISVVNRSPKQRWNLLNNRESQRNCRLNPDRICTSWAPLTMPCVIS